MSLEMRSNRRLLYVNAIYERQARRRVGDFSRARVQRGRHGVARRSPPRETAGGEESRRRGVAALTTDGETEKREEILLALLARAER